MDYKTSLAIPILQSLDDIAVRRKLSAIRSNVMNWRLDLVQYKNRWPSVMMHGFLILRGQSYLKNTQSRILEQNLVMLRSRDDGI